MVEGSSQTPPGSSARPSPELPPPGRKPRPPRAPGAYLRLRLWQRFVISIVVAVALLVAMIAFVTRHNTNSPTSTNDAAQVQANRDAEILIEQDQAPRSVRLNRGLAPVAAIERAIHTRIAQQIAAGAISGPLQPARCQASGPRAPGRRGFSCTVVAGSVSYPFLGVVDTAARRITFCKRDPPPVPSDNVPVSRRCRAGF
jgi:hypothetical protein